MVPRIRAVLTITVLALVPAAATAQFRPKVPNPQGKKAEDKVAARTTPPPTFNDRVLEITAARADQLIKGYRAEAAALDQSDRDFAQQQRKFEADEKGHPARRAAYEKQKKEWDACQEREVKPAEAESKKQMDDAQASTGVNDPDFQKKMDALKTRMQAAQAKGDMDEVMRLADSVQKAMAPGAQAATEASNKMVAAQGKCGPEPEEPPAPSPPLQQRPGLEAAGAGAAGLTSEQYAIMKERVEAALDEDGKLRSEVGFAGGEVKVLKQRGPEIAKAIQAVRNHGA